MTRDDLLAELLSERYGPTRPDDRYDSEAVKAARREALFRLPPAPGRRVPLPKSRRNARRTPPTSTKVVAASARPGERNGGY